jgi:hypothetical protein
MSAATSTPFSIRLSSEERARLMAEAGGLPLGTYLRSRLLAEGSAPRRKAGQTIANRQALAQALGLLGQSRYSSNLNQLAHLANLGDLPLTPEIVEELASFLKLIAEIRRLLVQALGQKADRA